VLDLACGTGSMSLEFARLGTEVIGVDQSGEMIARAAQKAGEAGLNILFLEQDMRALELYGTVDGAVCTLDGLNHLLTTADVAAALKKVSLFLEPGCLFLFDVNTPYKHREVLGNHTFVLETPEVFCVWRNFLRKKTCVVDIELDFFTPCNSSYIRRSVRLRERAYSDKTIRRLLSEAGFDVVGVYADLAFSPPDPRTERAVYAARKRG